jgi:hypothetical protein
MSEVPIVVHKSISKFQNVFERNGPALSLDSSAHTYTQRHTESHTSAHTQAHMKTHAYTDRAVTTISKKCHLLSHCARVPYATGRTLWPVSTWSSGWSSRARGTRRALGGRKNIEPRQNANLPLKCKPGVASKPQWPHLPSDPRLLSHPSHLGVLANPEDRKLCG